MDCAKTESILLGMVNIGHIHELIVFPMLNKFWGYFFWIVVETIEVVGSI